MFPFSTDKYTGITKISFDEFIARLENLVLKNVLYKTDGKFYGKIDIGFAKFELGNKPLKDVSKPIVVMKWTITNDKITVETKCRLDNGTNFIILLWLIFGIYLVIQDKDIKSILPILTLSIFAYLFAYIRYNIIKMETIKKLKWLFDNLEIEEIEF